MQARAAAREEKFRAKQEAIDREIEREQIEEAKARAFGRVIAAVERAREQPRDAWAIALATEVDHIVAEFKEEGS